MQLIKRRVPFLLLASLLSVAAVSLVMAETTSFQVQPQQQQVVSFSLNSGDSASGSIVMNGAGLVDFWITDPQNQNVTVHLRTAQAEFSLNAETSGTFVFHIFNQGNETVQGTLNYNLVHRIFGMSQEIFLLLVIVGIILLLLIVWGAMSKF